MFCIIGNLQGFYDAVYGLYGIRQGQQAFCELMYVGCRVFLKEGALIDTDATQDTANPSCVLNVFCSRNALRHYTVFLVQ